VRGPADSLGSGLWKELVYLPVATTSRTEFGRDHGDIQGLVDVTLAP